MRKNLLIGSITNFTWDDIAPFFNSFRKAGFENCDCVMFTGNMSERTINKMKSYGVTPVPIPERLNGKKVNGFRWELYSDYIRKRINEYDMVCTSDVRDVIFQKDLFKFFNSSSPFLGFAQEDCNISGEWSRFWITEFFGNEAYESIKGNPMICMGTVWGTAGKFCEFCEQMAGRIGEELYSQTMSDQNIANWLIYHEKKFDSSLTVKSSNADGCIMTIGATPYSSIKQDSAGNILNGKGEIAALVHQYDRMPEIVKLVHSLYGQGVLISPITRKKYAGTLRGLILRFVQKAYWNGLMKTLLYAVKKYCK